MVIYSIVEFIPFLEGKSNWIKWPFAIIVAFLATAYITPEEVYTILISYGAMGLILGAIIPFVILVALTKKLSDQEGAGSRILQYIIWIGFIGFLIYKAIEGLRSNMIGWLEFIVYGIIIIVSGVFILFNRQIMSLLFKQELAAAYDSEKKDLRSSLLGEVERRERDRPRGLSGGAAAAYDKKTEELRERAESM